MKNKCDSLHKLLLPWVSLDRSKKNIVITGIESDSRKIFLGNVFVGIQGCNTNGQKYIAQALNKGASAILLELQTNINEYERIFFKSIDVPLIYLNNLKKNLSRIASRYYQYPSHSLNIVGVTGTNGKTTISHLLAHWMQLLGVESAVMGTLGNGFLSDLVPSKNTTPSAITIQKILCKLLCSNIKFVAMEISSHALVQHRVNSLYFDAAVFTNLDNDHLDYHKNMLNYELAKWRLFNKLHVKKIVINADDFTGYRWLPFFPSATAVTTKNNLPKNWKGKRISVVEALYNINGSKIIFDSTWGSGYICSNLLGVFNVNNLLLALGVLLELGYSLSVLLNTVSQLKPVYGRMEVFKVPKKPIVIVDYAHTPNSLKQVLVFIKKYCQIGQLWCVFGCGGNRDASKRSLMGFIAEKYSDHIIITNDNPRMEEPHKIIDDIKRGITNACKLQIIMDRVQAINSAIFQASVEDCILISGKGHERYQIIKNVCLNHSDQEVVKKALKIL